MTSALKEAFPARIKTGKNNKRNKCKFEGVLFQEDGDGDVGGEFDMLTKPEYRRLYKRYDEISGGGVPAEERPTIKQMSALLGKLREDENPAPDYAVLGPFGNRAAKYVTRAAEVTIGGETKRRRIRGPDSYEDWDPCHRVFRGGMLILDGSPAGPLDAYEKVIRHLARKFPRHWSVIAFAEEACRTEKWPEYREEIEEMVEVGRPPKYWDPRCPWAAVIWMAAHDRNYWEDMVEKPILHGRDEQGAAEYAARQYRSYLPPSAIDGYGAMTNTPDGSVSGPYERRGRTGARAPWERSTSPGGQAPPEDNLSARDSAGRLTAIKEGGVVKQFCFNWCRGKNGCADPCSQGRAHRCELCTSTRHKTIDCLKANGKAKGKGKDGKDGKGGKNKNRKGKNKDE